MNEHVHPTIRRVIAGWCLPDGTRPAITNTFNPAPRSRAEYRDDCRAGLDCGPDDDEQDDDDEFEGAPV